MQNDELKKLCKNYKDEVRPSKAGHTLAGTPTDRARMATALLQRLEAEEAWYVLVRRVLLENVRDVIMNVQNDIRSPGDDALMPRLVNQINYVLLGRIDPRRFRRFVTRHRRSIRLKIRVSP